MFPLPLLILLLLSTLPLTTPLLPPSLPINCHGSFFCLFYAGANFIPTAYRLADVGIRPPPAVAADWNLGPLNASALYAPPNHVLCLPLGPRRKRGFCVFAHGGGGGTGGGGEGKGGAKGEVYVTGRTVREVLGLLVARGCRMCGSVWVGAEKGGWVTVNFVSGEVCKGVCPEARYR